MLFLHTFWSTAMFSIVKRLVLRALESEEVRTFFKNLLLKLLEEDEEVQNSISRGLYG